VRNAAEHALEMLQPLVAYFAWLGVVAVKLGRRIEEMKRKDGEGERKDGETGLIDGMSLGRGRQVRHSDSEPRQGSCLVTREMRDAVRCLVGCLEDAEREAAARNVRRLSKFLMQSRRAERGRKLWKPTVRRKDAAALVRLCEYVRQLRDDTESGPAAREAKISAAVEAEAAPPGTQRAGERVPGRSAAQAPNDAAKPPKPKGFTDVVHADLWQAAIAQGGRPFKRGALIAKLPKGVNYSETHIKNWLRAMCPRYLRHVGQTYCPILPDSAQS
jgi:hypothetical protein